MSDSTLSALVLRIKTNLIALCAVLSSFGTAGTAQTPAPTVLDFWVRSDTLFLEITLNAEALLAGLDPSGSAKLSESSDYRTLRRLVSSELEPRVKAYAGTLASDLQVQADGPLALSYEGVRIPVVGDPQTPRISRLLLAAPVPAGATSLRLTWPAGLGPLVMRQQDVDAPYTGYLMAGETSPLIPLQGGAALSLQQTLQVFFPQGLRYALTGDLQLILLVVALVALSFHLRPVASQILFVSGGLVIGLALGVSGAVAVLQVMLVQTVTVSIVVLALWNLILRRLHVLRLVMVFGIGGLVGLSLSYKLTDLGVPPDHLPAALLGYGAGVAGGLSAVALAVLAFGVVLSGQSQRRHGRLCVLTSISVAAIAVYWFLLG
ncbi:MAG: HupE/UreJ family protein [Pseudomonadota bacterium]